MKRRIRIYIEPEILRKLEAKAKEKGFEGRGAISRYIEKVAMEPICFLDENVKALLRVLPIELKN